MSGWAGAPARRGLSSSRARRRLGGDVLAGPPSARSVVMKPSTTSSVLGRLLRSLCGPLAATVLLLLLQGCASAPPAPASLFRDGAFKPGTENISAEAVFSVSPAMRQYLKKDIAGKLRVEGSREGLLDALYTKGLLQLEYDATLTRNASEAFDSRSGNCLALAIMTGAFAKELGLPIRFQRVFVEDSWSRNGDLYFVSGHVNVSLGRQTKDMSNLVGMADYTTIDFLPRSLAGRQRVQNVSEQTILAMFMNNRAAENLNQGRIDQAYWWARAALEQDPRFLASLVTLGVIYRRHGDPDAAEQVARYVLAQEPANVHALSNLLRLVQAQGRQAEAQALAARLAELQPIRPYHFFDLGVEAMKKADYQTARTMFSKEIERDAYDHEFHFWLALANYGLGDWSNASKQIAFAMEYSTTKRDRSIYAAKLDWLNARRAGL
ncbi:MAG: hypothetical protein ABW005_15725 [Burkholderiaceae bacterium]